MSLDKGKERLESITKMRVLTERVASSSEEARKLLHTILRSMANESDNADTILKFVELLSWFDTEKKRG